MTNHRIPGPLALSALLLAGSPCHAWTEESHATEPCHEEFTAASLAAAGYVREPPQLSFQDRQLFEFVQFDPVPYDHNIYMLSALIGSRWSDLHGESTFEIWDLLEELSDAEDAAEHCLRGTAENWEEGDERAVALCRDAIRSLARQAWTFADAGTDEPDPDIRHEVSVFLLYTGKTRVALSGFYFFAGRALHAIQDGFAHAYRTADRARITETANAVEELVGRSFDPERDGPAHSEVMDDCRCSRPFLDMTRAAVTDAGEEFLRLLYSNPATREEDLEVFLERWFTFMPGCTADNGYCASPDPASQQESACAGGCSVACGAGGEGGLILGLILAMLGVPLMPRRRRTSIVAGAALFLALMAGPGRSLAAEGGAGRAGVLACYEMPSEKTGPYAAGRLSGSLWRPALAIQGSVGWSWPRWLVGFVVEWNPWLALERVDAAAGAYVTGLEFAYMHPVNPRLKLRFGTVQGLAVLLFDPYGHHRGEVGSYGAYRILGLDIRVSRRVTIMFDPVDMVIMTVNPARLPLLYQQWRWSVAVKFM